jgi:hypothetical protein
VGLCFFFFSHIFLQSINNLQYLKKMETAAKSWKSNGETKAVLVPTDIIDGIADIAKFGAH